MKKVLKIIILVSVIMVMCSMSNFTYATEEDGRFVDIPVPPSSSGRADFTSEEADEQSKTYEESNNTKCYRRKTRRGKTRTTRKCRRTT